MSTPNPKNTSTDVGNLRGWGTCDQCGFIWNLDNLGYEKQWAGKNLVRNGNRVCPTCIDPPAPFLRTLTLPPDPRPLKDARPENYQIDEAGQ